MLMLTHLKKVENQALKAGCFLSVLLLYSIKAPAITWEFDEEGDNQGWTAVEGATSGEVYFFLSSLKSTVEDGVWRITPRPFDPEVNLRPSVQLISPRIDSDSELFDRVQIRLRMVGERALEGGGVLLTWTNTWNQETPGEDRGECGQLICSRFNIWMPEVVFTTDWQVVVFDNLRSGMITEKTGGRRHEILWEKKLIDLRLELLLGEVDRAAFWPEAVEIDRIVLTGIEEQLQGELPPPTPGVTPLFGDLFTSPVFSSIKQKGLGGIFNRGFVAKTSAAVGDLDEDGDLDLALPWGGLGRLDASGFIETGVISLINDGSGRFEPGQKEPVEGFDAPPYINGADIDADGRMDLLVVRWGNHFLTQTLFNTEEGWVGRQEFPTRSLGWADADGDDMVDLWQRERTEGESQPYRLLLYLNDGRGYFQEPIDVSLYLPEERFYPYRWVHSVDGGERAGVLWTLADGPEYVSYLDEKGEVVVQSLEADILDGLIPFEGFICYVGDVNGDGEIDFVASDHQVIVAHIKRYKGLYYLLNRGNGSFEKVPWLADVLLNPDGQPEPVQFLDLNGDPWPDPVLVDFQERQQAVLVGLGQEDGPPILEGRYPFEGTGGTLLGVDVDGDGDTDLVMVRSDATNEGIYVWLNQDDPVTAVEAEQASTVSGRFELGKNYPNPFNPQTWIPFEVPGEGGSVDLRIYNVLGQPIRRLVAGRLTAGHHRVPWDGRDSRGETVSAGMYLYRLQTGDGPITRKMLKVE